MLASHLILSAYGFWLPNDPRGSWSDWIRKWELLRFGPATKVGTVESVAATSHDYRLRQEAKKALSYPPVVFTEEQMASVAAGFETAVDESGYQIFACAILPEHVHVVVAAHNNKAARIGGHLKGRATQQLAKDGLHPLADYADEDGKIPSPWSSRTWKVYIFDEDHLRNAIRYVENNPIKEGLPQQRWPFVVRYEE